MSRVSHICDSSIAKAIDVLRLPPKSYAHAVMKSSRSVSGQEETKTERRRETYNFQDISPVSIYSSEGESMNIPNPLPLVVLIERIRLALLEEW